MNIQQFIESEKMNKLHSDPEVIRMYKAIIAYFVADPENEDCWKLENSAKCYDHDIKAFFDKWENAIETILFETEQMEWIFDNADSFRKLRYSCVEAVLQYLHDLINSELWEPENE